MSNKEPLQEIQQSIYGSTNNIVSPTNITAHSSSWHPPKKKVYILANPIIFEEESADRKHVKVSPIFLKVLEYVIFFMLQFCLIFLLSSISYVCFSDMSKNTALHAWLATFGFIFILSQGAYIYCNRNILTMYCQRYTKHYIHLAMQIIGSAISISGIFIQINALGVKYNKIHAIFGFTALISCSVSLAIGTTYYFETFYRRINTNQLKKTGHIICSMIALLFCYFALLFAYDTNYIITHIGSNMIILLKVITLITLILVLMQPLKTIIRLFY